MPNPRPIAGNTKRVLNWQLLTVALLGLCLSGPGQSACLTELPSGFPRVDIEFQTGLTDTDAHTRQLRNELGAQLFSDPRLSISGQHSCASCHLPERSFTDHLPRSTGALGKALPHNAPTLLNAALKFQFNWRSHGPDRLFVQHRLPLHNRKPVELGFEQRFLQRLNSDPALISLLAKTQVAPAKAQQPLATPAFTEQIVIALLAHYVSSLTCATAFDQYLLEGDNDAISPLARQGLELFTSVELGCSGCHRGPLLGGGLRSAKHQFQAAAVTRKRSSTTISLLTPSLRQVAHTAPYLFDGSLPSLDAVLDQYQQGAAVERPGFSLNPQQRAALLAFLHTL